jgi:hypothetical protein
MSSRLNSFTDAYPLVPPACHARVRQISRRALAPGFHRPTVGSRPTANHPLALTRQPTAHGLMLFNIPISPSDDFPALDSTSAIAGGSGGRRRSVNCSRTVQPGISIVAANLAGSR